MNISFSYYETEALRLAARIRELKGLSPEFIEARDTAQRHVERHYALIEQEENTLTDLRSQAAEAAMMLGVEPPAEPVADLPAFADLPIEEQAQVEAILNDDTPFEGINPAEELAEAIAAGHPAADFATVGDIAEQITAALANMAINQPDTADLSDSPELTTEKTEAIEAEQTRQVENSIESALKAYG